MCVYAIQRMKSQEKEREKRERKKETMLSERVTPGLSAQQSTIQKVNLDKLKALQNAALAQSREDGINISELGGTMVSKRTGGAEKRPPNKRSKIQRQKSAPCKGIKQL